MFSIRTTTYVAAYAIFAEQIKHLSSLAEIPRMRTVSIISADLVFWKRSQHGYENVHVLSGHLFRAGRGRDASLERAVDDNNAGVVT